MNKLLEQYLNQEPEHIYDKAKHLLDSMAAYCAIHGWTEKMEGADELNEAVDKLPRDNEIAVNMRFDKDLIRNNPEYQEFVSMLFDLAEQYKKEIEDEERKSN